MYPSIRYRLDHNQRIYNLNYGGIHGHPARIIDLG